MPLAKDDHVSELVADVFEAGHHDPALTRSLRSTADVNIEDPAIEAGPERGGDVFRIRVSAESEGSGRRSQRSDVRRLGVSDPG
jgi:hypothetical protein